MGCKVLNYLTNITHRQTHSMGKRMFLLAHERGHQSRPLGPKKYTVTTSAWIIQSAILASKTQSQNQTSNRRPNKIASWRLYITGWLCGR